MSTTFFFLIQFTILAYALVGGVFLAFSDFFDAIPRAHWRCQRSPNNAIY